ncbi:MAG: penicillin-binding protein activator [Nitrospinota bacterium]|nr:penicillin-binding protein activator [Nitrospinota bacterium]
MIYKSRRVSALAASLLFALLFAGCVSKEKAPISGVITGDIKKLAAAAEKAEAKKDQKRATELYKIMIANFPREPETASAWYHLGQDYLDMRDYRLAHESFSSVVKYFPDSKFFFVSFINMGISLVYLKQYEDAENVLTRALRSSTTALQKSTVLYFLGENNYLSSNYMSALERFIECYGVPGLYRSQAERRIKLIMHNVLSEKELLNVIDLYKNKFPADVAFIELSQIYTRNADSHSLGRLKKRMEKLFPGLELPDELVEEAQEEKEAGSVITIGCVLPLTGENSKRGIEIMKGIQLAFSMNNNIVEKGNVKLVIKDTLSQSSTVAPSIAELGEDNSVVAIIGPFTEDGLSEALSVAPKYRMPILSPEYSMETYEMSRMYRFPIGVTEDREGDILGEMAVERLGFFRAVILYPDSEYGKRMVDSFTTKFTAHNGEVVEALPYEPEATDFGPQIRAIGGMKDSQIRNLIYAYVKEDEERTPEEINDLLEMKYQNGYTIPYIADYKELPLTKDNFSVGLKLNYDAVFIPAPAVNAGLLVPELVFYNLSSAQVIGGGYFSHRDYFRLAQRHSERSLFPAEYFPESRKYAIRTFNKNYRNSFGLNPGIDAARVYDAVNILLSSIESGADTRSRIWDALVNLPPYIGVSGEFSGGMDSSLVKTPYLLTVRNGKTVEFEMDFIESAQKEEELPEVIKKGPVSKAKKGKVEKKRKKP